MKKIIIETQEELNALPVSFDEFTTIIIKSKTTISISVARGNSSVVAWGNSSVEAWGNSSVVAWGNSSVEAWGNSSVVARENSSVVLFDFSIAHTMSRSIDIDPISPKATVVDVDYPSDITEWCALKGLTIENGEIKMWKCTRPDGTDFRTGTINYDSNAEIICPDWVNEYHGECGHAIHLADCPSSARSFVNMDNLKTARLFSMKAKLEDCVCFGGLPNYPNKIRVRACRKVAEHPIDYKGR